MSSIFDKYFRRNRINPEVKVTRCEYTDCNEKPVSKCLECSIELCKEHTHKHYHYGNITMVDDIVKYYYQTKQSH